MPTDKPAKGRSSRKKMTPALKAELGQVNFYALKKAAEKKKEANKKASTISGREKTAARKKAKSSKVMTPALKAELGQANFYAMKKADEKKKAAGRRSAAAAKRK